VTGGHPPATRSDLTAMHLEHPRLTTHRLAPIGSEVDGRSVPSLE
jgi:hypothetical protein